MPNRSRDENIELLNKAFLEAGDNGLTLNDAKTILFGDATGKNSITKSILLEMKSQGLIKNAENRTDKFQVN